jgi:hypothetical protein
MQHYVIVVGGCDNPADVRVILGTYDFNSSVLFIALCEQLTIRSMFF